MNNIGRLVVTIKKDTDWVKFTLPDDREIKVLVKKASNSSFNKVVIDCPKDIKVNRVVNDNIGNR